MCILHLSETVNVINAYIPQVGLSEEEKKAFWDSLNEAVREILTNQRLILGGDLSGHIGGSTEGYSGVHEGFGYGVRNEEGDLKACKDCKVFPGEACSSQHRLLAMDTLFKRAQRRRVRSAAPRILWKNLNGDAAEAFRSRVSEGVSAKIEAISASDANSMWNALESIIKDASKDSFGVAIGTSKTHTTRRVSWWLCEEVQSKVAEKQARFRELLSWRECRNITDEEEIKKRWGEYFSSLFNTREPEGREGVVDENTLPLFDCYYSRINQTKVRTALQKMGRNKARVSVLATPESFGESGFEKEVAREPRCLRTVRFYAPGDLQSQRQFTLLEALWRRIVISPYLFALILDELSRRIQEDIPWCMIFADDIVLVSEMAEGLNDRLEN
ncbi:retrovirus-related pol polyprotein LINE-1 [Tanacetum coccineum]